MADDSAEGAVGPAGERDPSTDAGVRARQDAAGTRPQRVDVIEFTDPWCSWAWGTEPKLRKLRWRYGDRLSWRTVMGDLVPEREGFDPVRAARRQAEYWEGVHRHTGMPWPAGLQWAPARSRDAALGVKAAELQSDAHGAALLRAIRESCFVHGTPADDRPRVLAVAVTVEGLDVERLGVDMDRDEVAAALAADRAETRRPNEYVLTLQETHEGKGNAKPDGDGWRYVFPTLLFRGPGGEHTVPGWQPWDRYVDAMEAAAPGSTQDPRPDPTVEEAIGEWPTVTEHELGVLCAGTTRMPA